MWSLKSLKRITKDDTDGTFRALSVTITNGGAGFVVGNVITVSGGVLATFGQATRIVVAEVAAGVITQLRIIIPGNYDIAPYGTPITETHTGGGAGAVLTVTYTKGAVPLVKIDQSNSIITTGRFAGYFPIPYGTVYAMTSFSITTPFTGGDATSDVSVRLTRYNPTYEFPLDGGATPTNFFFGMSWDSTTAAVAALEVFQNVAAPGIRTSANMWVTGFFGTATTTFPGFPMPPGYNAAFRFANSGTAYTGAGVIELDWIEFLGVVS